MTGQLFRIDCFAWIIFSIGAVAVIGSHLESGAGTWQELLANVAPDLLRLLLVWAIVLFITKLFGRHEDIITETETMVRTLRQELPVARKVEEDALSTVKFAANLVRLSVDTQALKGMSAQSRDLSAEVIGEWAKYTEQLVSELTSEKRKSEDQIAFAALLKHYLSMEKVNLEAQNGYWYYQFNSWFVSYTLAVREIVEQMVKPFLQHEKYTGPYEFYTILPRTTKAFFNLLNKVAPQDYSIDFLESFNRGFLCRYQVPYFRRFLYLGRWAKNSKFEDPIIPWWDDNDELKQRFIAACNGNASVSRLCQVCRRSGNGDGIPTSHALLVDVEKNADCSELAGALGIDKSRLEPLIGRQGFGKYQYLIADELGYPAVFKSMGEILSYYHVTRDHCKGRLLTKPEYEQLYQATSIVPRDLMAIKQGGRWIYCVAAFFESQNSEALNIKVYGPECGHWEKLVNSLDVLFDGSAVDMVP